MNNKFLTIVLLLTFSLNAAAQGGIALVTDDPDLDEQEELFEAPIAPINDWVPYLILAGTFYGAFFFEKRRRSTNFSK